MRRLLSWQTAHALGGFLLALGALLAYAGQSASRAERRRVRGGPPKYATNDLRKLV